MSQNKRLGEILNQGNNKDIFINLEHNILLEIERLEVRKQKQNIFIAGSFVFVSLLGVLGSLYALWFRFVESGIYEIVSLAMSNYSELSIIWREISFAIIESIPMITIALFLSLIIAFIYSSIKTLEIISPKIRRA